MTNKPDIFEVSWPNLKQRQSDSELAVFYVARDGGYYTVIAASPTYGLVAEVYGDEAVEFDATLKLLATPVKSVSEAMGLSVVTNLSADGKALTAVYPATVGWKTYFTSRGDLAGPPIVRGGGQQIKVAFDAVEPRGAKEIEIVFVEPVEIHDGEAFYTPVENWTCDDYLSFGVRLGASSATAAAGDGNANKVEIAPGKNLFVPASGNGNWNLDLASAVPVPMATRLDPWTGYWNANHDTGVITPAANPGHAQYNLYDFAAGDSWLVKNVTLGNPLGVWDIDTYLAEWSHPSWKLIVKVEKNSPGAGVLSGSLLAYRLKTD